ncbi:DMT family transporter [Desulfonatronovibrio magnus]|uniref:DMT family transporter n=1 Tax=Desulfonatronovibrio magnus TaxID=698827 RepID=UPI0005EB4AC4|nr:DMT family transporter [Desulfonatronovibrio magnus]
MNDNTANLKAYTALIVAMFLWGSSFIALKLAFVSFDPMTAIFGRMLCAAVIMFFIFPRFKRVVRKPGDIKILLLMAFFEPCLYFIFEGYALKFTSASQAGMVSAIMPLMVAVSALFLLKESVNLKAIMGFTLAVAGGIWISIFSESTESAPNPVLGNFLEFIAIACASGYTICARYLSLRYHPLYLTAVQSFLGAVFFFPLMLISPAGVPTEFPLVPTMSVVYLGVIVTLVAYTCYNYGVSKIPAGRASAFINLVPVFTVVLGWIVLGERFTLIQFAGVILIFGGIIWANTSNASCARNSKKNIFTARSKTH